MGSMRLTLPVSGWDPPQFLILTTCPGSTFTASKDSNSTTISRSFGLPISSKAVPAMTTPSLLFNTFNMRPLTGAVMLTHWQLPRCVCVEEGDNINALERSNS